ncbi:exported hypothetical protein [Burkholderia sp. 8Y]|nr:exported hypothetical protein [Burkholderia sp. 8Y]
MRIRTRRTTGTAIRASPSASATGAAADAAGVTDTAGTTAVAGTAAEAGTAAVRGKADMAATDTAAVTGADATKSAECPARVRFRYKNRRDTAPHSACRNVPETFFDAARSADDIGAPVRYATFVFRQGFGGFRQTIGTVLAIHCPYLPRCDGAQAVAHFSSRGTGHDGLCVFLAVDARLYRAAHRLGVPSESAHEPRQRRNGGNRRSRRRMMIHG